MQEKSTIHWTLNDFIKQKEDFLFKVEDLVATNTPLTKYFERLKQVLPALSDKTLTKIFEKAK